MKIERVSGNDLLGALPFSEYPSHHGTCLHVSADVLTDLFGLPEAGDGCKTERQWYFTDEETDGSFSIYDYKDDRDEAGNILYHVGSGAPGDPGNYNDRTVVALAREAKFVSYVIGKVA